MGTLGSIYTQKKKTSLLRPWRPTSLEGWPAESSSTATAQGPRQDATIAMAAPVAGQSSQKLRTNELGKENDQGRS